MSWTSERARLAALTRHRPADDPALHDAARDLAALRLEEHIRRVVDTAPPLTEEQAAKLRALLPPPRATGRRSGAA